MKIVIDIPEDRYKDIQRIASVQLENYHFQTAEQIIANGTPLPKGRGRLIDADKIIHEMNEMKVQGETFTTAVNFAKILMREASTIIEADKAESEE